MEANATLRIQSDQDVDRNLRQIRKMAEDVCARIAAANSDPLDLFRKMKFETIGFHPISGHVLNLIEQVNQTWTYIAALAAARELLRLHPEAGGYQLAPGAQASIELDIMSEAAGLVGAETFAAVDPRNNRKLDNDLDKMAARTERHRYVFFISPKFPGVRHLPHLDRKGVQVWSVDV